MHQNLKIGLNERRNGKSDVLVKQRGSWQKNLKLKEKNKTAFFFLTFGKLVLACSISPLEQEREFVVDSGASVHMVSKKGFDFR